MKIAVCLTSLLVLAVIVAALLRISGLHSALEEAAGVRREVGNE